MEGQLGLLESHSLLGGEAQTQDDGMVRFLKSLNSKSVTSLLVLELCD